MRIRARLVALSMCAFVAPAFAAPGGKGTDVLHLTARAALLDAGVETGAAGDLSVSLRQQGNADVQKARLEVSGLTPETTYHLFALRRGANVPVEVLAFDTDGDGTATLKTLKQGLPALLDPLVDVLAVEVRNGGDQVVLSADLTQPDFLQYLAKRKLGNDGVDLDAAGSLILRSNGRASKLRLRASGLDPNADYTLVINGVAGAPLAADAKGRLTSRELPAGAPDALAIEQVELHDGTDTSVLSATIP